MQIEQKKQNFCNEQSQSIAHEMLAIFQKRKTTREYSDDIHVDINLIKTAIAIAGTAPSGANQQPWHFAIVSDPELKASIAAQADIEEQKFYDDKKFRVWHQALEPLHTSPKKSFLSEASYLIPIFYRNFEIDELGNKTVNYYAKDSVGIATGFLISALHMLGLSTLTYTPSDSKFMTTILGRPSHEKLFMMVIAGLPKANATVPLISKKTLNEISTIYAGIESRYSQ